MFDSLPISCHWEVHAPGKKFTWDKVFRNKPSPTVNRAQFFEDSSPQNIVPLPGASLVSKPEKCVFFLTKMLVAMV